MSETCDWCEGEGCDECADAGMDTDVDPAGDCDWCAGEGCEECSGIPAAGHTDEEMAADWGELTLDRQASIMREKANFFRQPSVEKSGSACVIAADQIALLRNTLVQTTAEELAVSTDDADCLLRWFDFSQRKLKNAWFDPGKRQLLEGGKGGVVQTQEKVEKAEEEANATVQCIIPFCDPVPASEATALGCGHVICNDHWAQHLTVELKNGPASVLATCPGMVCVDPSCVHSSRKNCKCQQLIPQRLFEKFIDDKDLYQMYQSWIDNRFVATQKAYRACPTPGCVMVIHNQGEGGDCACSCGRVSCSRCGAVPHFPVPCDLARTFLNKCSSDQATQKLIEATCKQCPNCDSQIQKLEKCSHMRCSNCSHEFCWLCKGAWATHTQNFFECSLYEAKLKEGHVSSEENRLLQAQLDLQHYGLYHKLWDTHKKASQKCRALRTLVAAAPNARFLTQTLDKLAAGHTFLQWTWALDYFMSGDGKIAFQRSQEHAATQLNALATELAEGQVQGWKMYAVGDDSKTSTRVARAVAKVGEDLAALRVFVEGDAVQDMLDHHAKHSHKDGWACTSCNRLHRPGDAKVKPPASAVSFTCDKCTFFNEHTGDNCTTCEAPRPKRRAVSPRPVPQKPQAKKKKKGPKWLRKRGKSKGGKNEEMEEEPDQEEEEEEDVSAAVIVALEWCAGCSACRRHGEKECHACVQ